MPSPLCNAPALVASGYSLALDIAVVDPPDLQTDLQAIEADISAHHAGVKRHFVLNNHASTRPQKSSNQMTVAASKQSAKAKQTEPANVVLRPKHWKLPPDQLVDSLPLSRGSLQALPVHISASQREALVTDLIRQDLSPEDRGWD